MILFSDYNTPYLFAISFVLLIGLLEIIAIICGHMLSGAIDALLIIMIPSPQVILARRFIISILEDCQLSSSSVCWPVFSVSLAFSCNMSASWFVKLRSRTCSLFL